MLPTADRPTAPRRPAAAFDPDHLASLEVRAWQGYYRRLRLWLFGLLVLALPEEGGASWLRALAGGA